MLKKLLLSISIVFCLFLTSSFAETNQTENSKEIKIQSGIAGKIKKVYIKKGNRFLVETNISLTAKKELIYVLLEAKNNPSYSLQKLASTSMAVKILFVSKSRL